MSGKESILEAEVIEIDGIAAKREPEPARSSSWKSTAHWQGRIRALDKRWWPLWIILGLLVLILAVSIGLCIFVLLAALKVMRALLQGFASLFSGGKS
jgi:hypothetical protein